MKLSIALVIAALALPLAAQHREEIEPVHLLQIWIMPDKRGATPTYGEKSYVSAEPGKLHLVASKAGRAGSIAINQDADLYLAKFTNGQTVSHTLRPNRHAWIHVAEGEVRVNGQSLVGGDAAALSDEAKVEIAGEGNAQVLVFDLN